MSRADDRAGHVNKIIKKAWASLVSHVYWTNHKSREGKAFHKRAIKEYASIIDEASELY